RTSSRLRRTNDRSALGVHEDHEDDENAEIGVSLHAQGTASRLQSLKYCMPNLKYCTDNAAMIASAGYFQFISIDEKNREQFNNYSLNTFPKLT
ncbi:MAG: hypothetical protein ACKO3R_07065, partial [bacterium]